MPVTALAHALRSDILDTLAASVTSPFYAELRKFVEALPAGTLPGVCPYWVWVDEAWFDGPRLYETLKSRGAFIGLFSTPPPHAPWECSWSRPASRPWCGTWTFRPGARSSRRHLLLRRSAIVMPGA